MKSLVALSLFLSAIQCGLAHDASVVVEKATAISSLLLPEVKNVREGIQEHNRRIDEKTDTFMKAFIHYNFSKDRHVDETPYFEMQMEIERVGRYAKVLEAVAMLRERAERKGEVGRALHMRKEEQEHLPIVRQSIEKIVADSAKTELKVDRDALNLLVEEFRVASRAYSKALGLQEVEAGEPGATDNLGDAQ